MWLWILIVSLIVVIVTIMVVMIVHNRRNNQNNTQARAFIANKSAPRVVRSTARDVSTLPPPPPPPPPIDNDNLFRVVAIMKNETMTLATWLEHYRWQGASHIYLIDNGSTDSPLRIVQPWIDQGFVTFVERPELHKQREHTNEIVRSLVIPSQTQWLLVCDLDEFLFSPTLANLAAFLKSDDAKQYDAIYVPWMMFGSDRQRSHPRDVRLANRQRQSEHPNSKYMVRTSALTFGVGELPLDIHLVNHLDPTRIRMCWPNDTLVRNHHYQLQSSEFYNAVKIARGDVCRKEWDSVRTRAVFDDFNAKCNKRDDTLANLVMAAPTATTRKHRTLLHLVLYSESDDGVYERMRQATRNYYNKFHEWSTTLYYMFSNEVATIEFNEGSNTLLIPGSETYVPGILNKTLQAFAFAAQHFDCEYVLRSNISTLVNMSMLRRRLEDVTQPHIQYGGSALWTLSLLDPQGGIVDNRYFGQTYGHGTGILYDWATLRWVVDHAKRCDSSVIDDVSLGLLLSERKLAYAALGMYVRSGVDDEETKRHVVETMFIRHKSASREEDVARMMVDISWLTSL